MNETTVAKHEHLKKIIRDTKGLAVAFSGGVDSTLVLTVAHEMLGERCLAVIATSSTYPDRECKQAIDWVKTSEIPHLVISSEELDIPEFSKNPTNRCYYCKKELFEKVGEVGRERGLEWVSDGSNADDVGDYRPGMSAARELGVVSPLMEAGITKAEVREISREVYNLATADKPAMACLASRFPYGSMITKEKLNQVETIENFLDASGLKIFRARHHGTIVRLELGAEELARVNATENGFRDEIVALAKKQGFHYVTVDLEGFRSGSMNETLK